MSPGVTDSSWSTDTHCPGEVAVNSLVLLSFPFDLHGTFVAIPKRHAAQVGILQSESRLGRSPLFAIACSLANGMWPSRWCHSRSRSEDLGRSTSSSSTIGMVSKEMGYSVVLSCWSAVVRPASSTVVTATFSVGEIVGWVVDGGTEVVGSSSSSGGIR